MKQKFFAALAPSKSKFVTARDIISTERASMEGCSPLIYEYYARHIRPRSLDSELRLFRQKALGGCLDAEDYRRMNDLLEVAKRHARQGGWMMPLVKPPIGNESGDHGRLGEGTSLVHAYGRVKSYAMLIAQILFVNNVVQEGLPELIEPTSLRQTIDDVSKTIRAWSSTAGPGVGDDEARFYAALFIFQTVFDQLFVPERSLDHYNAETGKCEPHPRYQQHVGYLSLANRRVALAGDAERLLCWNITTGWSDGIDLATWDRLNHDYYSEISPTTGAKNLFATHYDVLLERMLPQFA